LIGCFGCVSPLVVAPPFLWSTLFCPPQRLRVPPACHDGVLPRIRISQAMNQSDLFSDPSCHRFLSRCHAGHCFICREENFHPSFRASRPNTCRTPLYPPHSHNLPTTLFRRPVDCPEVQQCLPARRAAPSRHIFTRTVSPLLYKLCPQAQGTVTGPVAELSVPFNRGFPPPHLDGKDISFLLILSGRGREDPPLLSPCVI